MTEGTAQERERQRETEREREREREVPDSPPKALFMTKNIKTLINAYCTRIHRLTLVRQDK